MRKLTLLVLTLLMGVLVQAQMLNPINWQFSQKQLNDSTAELIFTATMESGWHLYSQKTPEGGSLPTVFEFAKNKNYKRIGEVREPKPKVVYEEVFGVDVYFFESKEVRFSQKVLILSEEDVKINGTVSGQTCTDVGACIPFNEIPFSFTVKGRTMSGVKTSAIDTTEQLVVTSDTAQNTASVAGVKSGDCKDLVIEGLVTEEEKKGESESYWIIFLLGFGGGLVALLTPCVFPMIPLTVSFFTKNSGTRKKGLFLAVIYGLSIAAIYTLIAVPFIVAKVPPDTLNEIATSATLNIVFFIIFVAFAISFFGYYEIALPSSLANKADSASNMGGLIGVFFMAITLALVSFSCTGPILGSFLAGTLATNPDPYNILFVMLGFGTALGLPFALFAAFPAWLNSLPKSGGWLNSVKVVLGFLELGMALKFLSNADLVEQWGILKRETFLVIWTLLALGLAAYLMGLIKFPHDSKIKKFGPIRIGLATVFAASGIYFATGLFGANLELISGFPPPMFYSYSAKEETKVEAEHDFYAALERAKKENKPLLVDFTGWACVNCRRMEEGVWVDPEVKKIMSEQYVLVSLYVDEKKELPENEQFTSCVSGRRVKTVGNKWSNLQIVNFKSNSQPQYVVLSPEGKQLAEPVGYTDKSTYLTFLKSGLDGMKATVASN